MLENLVDPRPIFGGARLQRGTGERLIDITSDRASLIEMEPAILESRDAPKRVPRHMLGRRTALSKYIYRGEVVGNPLFLQGETNGADVHAVRCAIDCRPFAHSRPLATAGSARDWPLTSPTASSPIPRDRSAP